MMTEVTFNALLLYGVLCCRVSDKEKVQSGRYRAVDAVFRTGTNVPELMTVAAERLRDAGCEGFDAASFKGVGMTCLPLEPLHLLGVPAAFAFAR